MRCSLAVRVCSFSACAAYACILRICVSACVPQTKHLANFDAQRVYTAVRCSALQCAAVRYSALQCVAMHASEWMCVGMCVGWVIIYV